MSSRTGAVVPTELQDTLPVLEGVLLLLVGLDVVRETVGEGKEEVGEVATAALVEFLGFVSPG